MQRVDNIEGSAFASQSDVTSFPKAIAIGRPREHSCSPFQGTANDLRVRHEPPSDREDHGAAAGQMWGSR